MILLDSHIGSLSPGQMQSRISYESIPYACKRPQDHSEWQRHEPERFVHLPTCFPVSPQSKRS